jgi:hypothetical protein
MVIVCSRKALDPVEMARVCREDPCEEVYALPWVQNQAELDENLKVNRGKPDRMLPCEPNKKDAEGRQHIDFYDRLQDDCFGLMAHALTFGTPVLNETMECPCESAFYGKILVPAWVPGATAIIRCTVVNQWFPTEPVSATVHAMTTVPVMLRNTEQFKVATGCHQEEVPVVLASDFIPKIVTFMRFYKLFAKKDFIFSVDSGDFERLRPILMRYNRAYKET